MRRNPRPFRPVDRRRLAMDMIEREARAASMSSQAAIEGAINREHAGVWPRLTLPPPRKR